MLLTPGTRLGPYEIQGPLGAGGMGEVYLARDTRLDRDVAVKVLPPGMAQNAEAIGRFRREALTLASLNHPNIATVYGLEELPGGPTALVLERVEGHTLAERLRRGALPMPEAIRTCIQIAQALEVAHERGVIHRDVKPANVMIGPRGLVKVLDFGLASRIAGLGPLGAAASVPVPVAPREPSPDLDADTLAMPPADDRTVTASGMAVGTPGYMSPEQVMAGALDERTDIFAIGCVLYECLAGRRAFPGSDVVEIRAVTLERPADLSLLPENAPDRVRELIERCLAKDPESRPRNMRTVRLELEEVLGIRHTPTLREGRAGVANHNLPAPTTGFVGRETALAECAAALERGRLLSLVGIGGSGKTRLALQLAEAHLGMFPGGVWFLDVAPLTEPERLVEVLAAALEVPEEPGRSALEGITRHLAARRALILFDNSETHLGECARLAGHLLAACRELKVLVTSREPLGIDGETVYTVPALGTPAPGVLTAASANASDAVRLFVERARAASPDFELTDGNATAVAEICRKLDGIPLALELAAARVRLLGVEQIRSRLGDRFRLLTRGGGAPTRQQTMLATIQWSWDHLLPPEQDLMRRLAVFTGGWDLERAVEVCSDSGDEFEMLDLLTRLAERLLVVVERGPDGDARYRFLESVGRFALEKLEGHPEHEAIRERHLAAFEVLAERALALTGQAEARQLAALVHDEENLLAAVAWSPRAADGVRRGLRLVGSVSLLWSVRGRYAVGRRATEEALARDVARAPTLERARALRCAAKFAMLMGDHGPARLDLEESLAISRATGDRKGMAAAFGGLGSVAMYESRFSDATSLLEDSLAIYRELGEKDGVALALYNLGVCEGELKLPGGGQRSIEASLVLAREAEDLYTEALCLTGLSWGLVHVGQAETARQRLRECLTVLERTDVPPLAIAALDALTAWLLIIGRNEEAARILGAVEAARTALDSRLAPHQTGAYEWQVMQMDECMGVVEAERSRAAGRTLTLSQALAEARALLEGVPRSECE